MNKLALLSILMGAFCAAASITAAMSDEEFENCLKTDMATLMDISVPGAVVVAWEKIKASGVEYIDETIVRTLIKSLKSKKRQELKAGSRSYLSALYTAMANSDCKIDGEYFARLSRLPNSHPEKSLGLSRGPIILICQIAARD